jgi:hypothetical protein
LKRRQENMLSFLPNRLRFVLLFVIALSQPVEPGFGQRQGQDEPLLTPEYREKAIDWIGAKLDDVYVFPDVAEKMYAFLRAQLESGAYDSVDDIEAFAEMLTTDLRSVSHDEHLGVSYDPQPSRRENETDEERKQRRDRIIEQQRADNFMFKKVEHLTGNVGYLRFDGFLNSTWAGDTAIAALSFLANCDALIIDLRYNGGGDPTMIQLITSYFFDEPKHINSFYIRKDDRTKQFWTSAHVVGKRMADTDLYVLTSGRTFSAAEEFTYNLKSMERATIVGETTRGGAHPTDYLQNDELKIGLSVPFGRAVNPITGTNWEGTGIEPHVKVSAERALDEAYRLALQKLRDEAEGDQKKLLQWVLDYHSAVSSPPNMDSKQLMDYAGTYGPRVITLEDDRLYYQREGGVKYALFPMTEDMFVLEELQTFRIQFERDASGTIVAIRGIYWGGREDRTAKTTTERH